MVGYQHVHSGRSRDFDSYHDSFYRRWNELALLEPVGKRPFEVAYRRLLTRNLFLMEMQSSGYTFGFSESDFIFLGVPVASGVRSMESDAVCGPGSVVVYGQRPFRLTFGDGDSAYRGMHIGVRRSTLRAWSGADESPRRRSNVGAATVLPIAQARGLLAGLARAVPFVVPGGACAADFVASVEVEDQVVQALLDTPAGQYMADMPEKVARAGCKPVLRATEFIRGNFDLEISAQEIADAAGVGVRSLQVSFRESFGKSPWEYLVECRLAAVRMRLSNADDPASITTVALDCGFNHLGEFSRRYRAHFGETPSETRRRAIGAASVARN